MATKSATTNPMPKPTRPTTPVEEEVDLEEEGSASSHIQLDVEEVDAATAEEWLGLMASNRVIRKRRVLEFRRDMLAGNWREVGDPIRFDVEGKLRDGQHRLAALISAAKEQPDITIPMVIARGLHPEDHVVIDTGTRRTASDQLKIAGYNNYAILAASARWCLLWERQAVNTTDTMLKTVTHPEVMEYVENHEDLQTIVNEVGAGVGRRIDMPNGYIAACWYLCWRVNPEEADEFFYRFSDGIGLYDGDPLLALRNRLREVVRNRGNLSGTMYLSLVFRAWNAKREGRTLRALPLDRQGVPIPAPELR